MTSTIVWWMALLAPAQAQDEACAGAFARAEWVEAMDAVNRAVDTGNTALARRILDQVHDALRCSGTVVQPVELGRFARQMAVVAFYAQERDDAARWALLARETVGAAPWPEALSITSAYTEMEASLEPPQRGGPQGRGFTAPTKGAVLLDGRLALQAEASVSVPHLLQIADKKGVPLSSRWVDGIAFPDDVLGEPETWKAPSWYVPPPPPATEPAVAAVDEPAADPPAPAPSASPPPTPVPAAPAPTRADDGGPPACPWKKVGKARIEAGAVVVNHTVYEVRQQADHQYFLDVLLACEEYEAAGRFQKWQEARRLNPFDGSVDRDAMVRALLLTE